MGAVKNYIYDNIETVLNLMESVYEDPDDFDYDHHYNVLQDAVMDDHKPMLLAYQNFIQTWIPETDPRKQKADTFLDEIINLR